MIWLLLGLMALITFSNRYALFSPRFKFSVGPKLQSLLKYTAPAVLTALWVPIVFIRNEQLDLQINNPYLIAGVVTIATSLLLKKPLVTVMLGITIFMVLSHLI
ncbi:AzlD domain-containing protein [Endozoicomonas sp. Mp262]|uniref:AzlD domain-containing protein n=1 Tax=Endozoicomonas sp. Mp262 TaxID=2919499 RepID=UPI0021D8B22D